MLLLPFLCEELDLHPWECHKLLPSLGKGDNKPQLARVVLGLLQHPSQLQMGGTAGARGKPPCSIPELRAPV